MHTVLRNVFGDDAKAGSEAVNTPSHNLPKVFLLPGIGGYNLQLAHFSAGCRHAMRIIVIPYRKWPELVQPAITFETLVADAVANIVAHAPSGPVRIVGLSMGGHVAYGAALALSAAGRSVSFLGLLDTDGERTECKPLHWSRLLQLRHWARFGRAAWLYPWDMILVIALPVSLVERPAIKWLLRRLAWVLPNLPSSVRFRVNDHLNIAARLALLRSWHPVVAEPLSAVPCFLFRAESNPPHAADDLGWRRRCAKVTVVPVPGSHTAILDDPHRRLVCEAISAVA